MKLAIPKPKKQRGRTFKKDPVGTAAAGFLDKRSYVSFRQHWGTGHVCEYLKGRDATERRATIFAWAGGIVVPDGNGNYLTTKYATCKNCGCDLSWGSAELDHILGGNGAERCWCPTNLQILCHDCHTKKHGREPRFGQKNY